jgi:hypothetical protein
MFQGLFDLLGLTNQFGSLFLGLFQVSDTQKLDQKALLWIFKGLFDFAEVLFLANSFEALDPGLLFPVEGLPGLLSQV